MRRLIVSVISSLDGYHEGPDHSVLALPFDQGFSAYNLERLDSATTLLVGRRTYETFRDYWPPVADDPAQAPEERAISQRNNAIDKVVVSDTLGPGDTGPWAGTTRIVGSAEANAAVNALKEGEGGDILVFGSATLWNALLTAGLVDELHVLIGPALLGDGTALFSGPAPVSLRLLESRVLDDSQLVLHRYAPAT